MFCEEKSTARPAQIKNQWPNLWHVTSILVCCIFEWPLALDGHRNGIKFRDIHYGQINIKFLFALLFVFFFFLFISRKGTWHWALFSNVFNHKIKYETLLCQNYCQIFVFFVKNENLHGGTVYVSAVLDWRRRNLL